MIIPSPVRLFGATLTIVAATITMSGCALNQLPPYETVQQETDAALHRIVDTLPQGAAVGDLTDDVPLACGDEGALYTAHWVVPVDRDFDGEAYAAGLPDQVGPDLIVRESAVELSQPAVRLIDERSGVLVSVTVLTADGGRVVDLLGRSRCAAPPDENQQ